jgi:2-polyprenyl-3-methyl-5-hydroxy-6-metoxy-1,4-benzoquinol methylase
MMTPNEETCSQPCNLCGGTHVSVLANRCRSGKPLRTVICQACGLVWSDPFPHDTRSYYEDDYRVQYKGAFTPKPKHILRAGEVALSRRKKLGSLIDSPQKILDVGSGGGEFAYLLKTLGHDVYGIEPNRGYCDYSEQEYDLNVQNGFILDIQQPPESFDLITIWHVLEHTENPSAVMAKLRDLLKPEGKLVVEVPSIEAVCQAPKSTFHEAHLFNFNPETLEKLGDKCGFSVVERQLATDGGNMTVIFRKTANKANANLTNPANAEKIQRIVQEHTPLKHYFSAYPYSRFVKRLWRSLREKMQTRTSGRGRVILDTLYRNAENG